MGSLYNVLNPQTTPLSVGKVVAFDFTENKEWQWALGTLKSITEHTATVQQWAVHEGDMNTLKNILNKEVESEKNRTKMYQNMLGVAKDTLAAIRCTHEDRVNEARQAFDECRENISGFDEVQIRTITSQTTPSPVAMAVLKGVLAVAKCDPSIDEYYSWGDIQAEYRKGSTWDDILKADILSKIYPAAESLKVSLEDRRLSLTTASRDSPLTATLHQWITKALGYQEAYRNSSNDKRIQEQNDIIASAIAGMKASRAKMEKLKEELQAKRPTGLPGQITSFTKTSVELTIPLSTVICSVQVDNDVTACALTDDEVNAVMEDAKLMRFSMKEQLNSLASAYVDVVAELNTLSMYTTELEEKRLHLFEHVFSGVLRSEGGPAKVEDSVELEHLKDLVNELKEHDDRWEFENGPTSTSTHAVKFPGEHWNEIIRSKPEEVNSAYVLDVSLACHIPPSDVTNVRFLPRSSELQAECDIVHPASMSKREVDRRLLEYPKRNMDRVYERRDGPKSGLDRAITDTCRALGIDESKFAGMSHEQFVELLSGFDYFGDKDAYESEIGDLLMLLDKIHNENRSLQYTLEQSADRFKKQTAALKKEQDALRERNEEMNEEIDRLRNLVEKLKDLADKQGSELELYRLQQEQAQQLRSQRNLSEFNPEEVNEPIYCVTLDELNNEREVAEEAQQRAAQLQEDLQTNEDTLRQLNEQLQQSEKENNELQNQLDEANKELGAHRQKRHDAREARAGDAELAAVDGVPLRSARAAPRSSRARGPEPSEVAVDPSQIETEPLYAVTLDELKDKRDSAEQLAKENEKLNDEAAKLAEELEKQKDEIGKLTAALEDANKELGAHRQKRHDAREARAGDAELAAVDGVPLRSARAAPRSSRARGPEPSEVAVDPSQIETEPLYAVTLDELKDKRDSAEQLAKENEKLNDEAAKLAEELEKQKAENEMLTAALEDANKELGAHRQKRHDAREARAGDAELAAVDGVPLRSARAAPRSSRARGPEPSEVAVDPSQIETEPLYAVTLDELKDKRDSAEQLAKENEKLNDEAAKLAEELEKQKAENEMLTAALEDANKELGAHRQKRHDAREARAGDAELAAVDGVPLRSARAAPRSSRARGPEPSEVAVDPSQIETEPLYAVTLDELKDKRDSAEQLAKENEKLNDEAAKLAEELEKQKAENEMLTAALEDANKELGAHRQKRHDAREARAGDAELAAVDGVPLRSARAAPRSSRARGPEPSEVAVDPSQIETEPLYAVTLDELKDKRDSAEQLAKENEKLNDEAAKLAEELEKQKDEIGKLTAALEDANKELGAHRQKRHDAREARAGDAELAAVDGVPLRSARAAPRSSRARGPEPSEVAVDPSQIETEPLYAVTLDELKDKRDSAEQLAKENEKLNDEAAKLAEELEKQKTENDKLADENEKLADELEKEKAENDKLAGELEDANKELAAHREKRLDAKDARACDPELAAADGVPVRSAGAKSRSPDEANAPVSADTITSEPLYAATLDELNDKRDALDELAKENEKLAEELGEQKAENERLAGEVETERVENDKLADEVEKLAAENEKLADELEKEKAENEKLVGELEYANKELGAHRQKRQEALDARASDPELAAADGVPVRASGGKGRESDVPVDPSLIESEPLFCVTLDELQNARARLEELEGENDKLIKELVEANDEIAEQKKYNINNDNSDPSKPQITTSHEKVFEGDEWNIVLEDSPEELKDVFTQDTMNACRVSRGSVKNINFVLGSLHANFDLTHNADISAEEMDEFIQSYGYPGMADMYANRRKGRRGIDAVMDDLAKNEEELANEKLKNKAIEDELDAERQANKKLLDDNEQLAGELEKQKRENENLAEENEKLAGENEKLADELGQQKAENDKLADENEKLAEELGEQKAENDKLADENEKLAGENEKLADELGQQKAENDKLADENEKLAGENEKLADELEKEKAENDKLAGELEDANKELAAHREKRLDAKDARACDPELAAADGVPVRSAGAKSRSPDEANAPVSADTITSEPLYAATLDELNDKRDALDELAKENEKLAEELGEQKAENDKLADENEKLADELEKEKAENDKLADENEKLAGENEKLAEDVELQKAENDKLADENEKLAGENEKLADELEKEKAENDKLAGELEDANKELAAHREKRLDAKDARACDPELAAADGVPVRSAGAKSRSPDEANAPVSADTITSEPLYAATLDELNDKRDALDELAKENEKLAEELGEQKAENDKLADENEKLAGENEKLAEDLELQKAENDKLADTNEKLEGENEKLAEELGQQKAENDKLADENEKLAGENENLGVELENERAEVEKVLENCNNLKNKWEGDREAAESELLDVVEQLKAVEGENAALRSLLEEKKGEVEELKKHDDRWITDGEKKVKVVSRHTKIFDGNWRKLLDERPEALFCCFCNRCV